jgi:hypothetical protein
LWLAEGLGRTSLDLAKGNLSALAAWYHAVGLPFEHPPQAYLINNTIRLSWPKEKQMKELRKPIGLVCWFHLNIRQVLGTPHLFSYLYGFRGTGSFNCL